jgi:hypothetical protein
MSRALLKRAVRAYRNELAPREIRRANARAWLKSVQYLGPKWILSPARAAQRSE